MTPKGLRRALRVAAGLAALGPALGVRMRPDLNTSLSETVSHEYLD